MSNGPEDSTGAGWNVELTAEAADRAEAILRDFATDAELEMAIIVDRSGGMIAGVATRQNVDVATVGALVAGAFGAMGALAHELGEPEVAESLHHGSGDTIYLRQIGERFILLGVTTSELPSGLVREKGAQIAGPLGAILSGNEAEAEAEAEEPAPAAEPEVAPPAHVAADAKPDVPIPAEPEPAAQPVQTDIFVERPAPAEQGSAGGPTGLPHTEISVEDGHSVSMASLNPAVRRPEPEPEPAPSAPEPQKEKPGENSSYVFEIG